MTKKRKETNAFNAIVSRSASIRKGAKKLKGKISDELNSGNELLTKFHNRNLVDFPQKVLTASEDLVSNAFVFSNIEHLFNGTLKKLYDEGSTKLGRKNQISPYHKAMIVRSLARGYTLEKVKSFYNQYSLAQIKAVEREFRFRQKLII